MQILKTLKIQMIEDKQLSKNFSLYEFLHSQAASRFKVTEQFEPSQEVVNNLTNLCREVIQPLRDAVDTPLTVSSGYRCPKVNGLVGGQTKSQHLTGQAADLICPGKGNAYLFNKIIELKLPFDQLIWEYGTDKEPDWVHVSFGPRNRRQILTIK